MAKGKRKSWRCIVYYVKRTNERKAFINICTSNQVDILGIPYTETAQTRYLRIAGLDSLWQTVMYRTLCIDARFALVLYVVFL